LICISNVRVENTILLNCSCFSILSSHLGEGIDTSQQIEDKSFGTGYKSLSLKSIKELKIPLPPTLAEQEAIAGALRDADALIESLEQLVAKKRQIKQGAMQELLQTKDGWIERRLGEIAFVTKLAGFEYTNYFNSYKDEGEIIVIRGTNITQNSLDLSDVKTIPKSISNKLPRSQLHKGDLVFAYVGTIGPVYLVEEDSKFHLGPNTCKISVDKSISPEYLNDFFKSEMIIREIFEHTSISRPQ